MRDPVSVVPYDPSWPTRFRTEAARIRHALGAVALRIDHHGSTAVPGLAAKPVIDIQVSVRSFEPLDAYRNPLEQLGFPYRTDHEDPHHRFFREPDGRPRRTHIHVREAGGEWERLNLLFRDYLRAQADAAAMYAALKPQLAERFRDDRRSYTEA